MKDYHDEYAFPGDPNWPQNCQGMTLRDWFAGKALQSLMIKSIAMPSADSNVLENMATLAYKQADKMMECRKNIC